MRHATRPRRPGLSMMLRTLLMRGVLFGSMALSAGGCGDDDRNPGAGGEKKRPPIPEKCMTPGTGCPCSTDVVAKCGELVSREGDLVTCRQGERTCSEGAWSECVGTKSAQVYAPRPAPPGVQVQGLAPGPEDCDDACDP
jgi:hypothetical protein